MLTQPVDHRLHVRGLLFDCREIALKGFDGKLEFWSHFALFRLRIGTRIMHFARQRKWPFRRPDTHAPLVSHNYLKNAYILAIKKCWSIERYRGLYGCVFASNRRGTSHATRAWLCDYLRQGDNPPFIDLALTFQVLASRFSDGGEPVAFRPSRRTKTW